MDYQYILYNIVTSTFLIGIVTFLIEKYIDKRFNKIEEFQKTLLTVRKEQYDTLLKTLQEIWEKIIETEYYIRHDIIEQYKLAQKNQQSHLVIDSTPIKNAFIFIEKRSILLDESLSSQTSEFFIKHLQRTYNGYVFNLNKLSKGEVTLGHVNTFISEALGESYKEDLSALKRKYEEQARKILYDNNESN